MKPLLLALCIVLAFGDLSGSAGQLIPGIAARVEKPDGTLAEFDEPGELVVRTPSLALGYAGNPGAYVDSSLRAIISLIPFRVARRRPL